MGEHADDALDRAAHDLEELLDYQMGNLSTQEAIERGILDEHGSLPPHAPNLYGVHDVESLTWELDRCELEFRRATRKPKVQIREPKAQVWVTADGKRMTPDKMTTAHLRNSIRFAEREGFGDAPLVDAMKRELDRRSKQ